MMNAKQTLVSLGMAVASTKIAKRLSNLEADDFWSMVGLERRRSHTASAVGLIGLGAVVGAGVALLFAPDSGKETRKRILREADKLGQAAGEIARDVQSEAPALIARVTNRVHEGSAEHSHHS
ncbi:MAG: YtxH domain-containing protein [Polyangiaceae bacterium]